MGDRLEEATLPQTRFGEKRLARREARHERRGKGRGIYRDVLSFAGVTQVQKSDAYGGSRGRPRSYVGERSALSTASVRAADGGDDNVGPQRAKGVIAEAEALALPRVEALNHNIAHGDKTAQEVRAAGRHEVERAAQLVAIELSKSIGPRRYPAFDGDDFRAGIAEQTRSIPGGRT
jgi:hypothetical protein